MEKEQARSTRAVCLLEQPGSSLHRGPRILDELNTLPEDRLVVEETMVMAKTADSVTVDEKEAAEEKEGSEEEAVGNRRTRSGLGGLGKVPGRNILI